MSSIDYIYRYDPDNPEDKSLPPDPPTARQVLEEGNRVYSRWIEECRSHQLNDQPNQYIVPWHGLLVDIEHPPRQAPFAVILGCADARVPIEMVFGQASNDLFVVRVAGNVLANVCMGSIEYALSNLAETVKCVVVLGHLNCGAVTDTVKAYLHPAEYAMKIQSTGLRSIVQSLFTSVKLADDAIHRIWGPDAPRHHEYHDALIHVSVCVNAAQSALDLRNEVKRSGHKEIEVLYGVFNMVTHQVRMPADPRAPRGEPHVNLAHAPRGASGVTNIAELMAEIVRPKHVKRYRPAAKAAASQP